MGRNGHSGQDAAALSISLPYVTGITAGQIVTVSYAPELRSVIDPRVVTASDALGGVLTFRATGVSELGMDLELDTEPTGAPSGIHVTLGHWRNDFGDVPVADAETARRKAGEVLAGLRADARARYASDPDHCEPDPASIPRPVDYGVDGTPLKSGGAWPIGRWPDAPSWMEENYPPPRYAESLPEFEAEQRRYADNTLGLQWTGAIDDLPPPEPGSPMDEAYRRTLRSLAAGRDQARRFTPEEHLAAWDEMPDELVPQHMPVAPDDPDSALCERCGRSLWNAEVHHLRKGGPRG